MNILIPDSWLKDHLETNATPSQIQEYLSLCGPSVERIDELEGDSVYTIEVTTNRVDCMSIRGIAREASAILPEFGIASHFKTLKLTKPENQKRLDIHIQNNPQLCRRILAVKLENVKLGPSPKWMQKRLWQVGQRPLNNLIDITNYVMWEIGHPVHVFDYDRLREKTIIVREAKPGEKLVTLDDKEYRLKGGEVVFDNGKGAIIDLPGIMGTKNSVVTESTRNILLWIESIDARKIRDASMDLSLRTQAAVLNEKGVDPEFGLQAMLRAIYYYRKLTSAKIGSRLVDEYPYQPKVSPITLPQKLLDSYMNIAVKPNKVERILTALGCRVKTRSTKSPSFKIFPPSWRAQDLRIPEDAIEEIARIYGYHRLPSSLMQGELPITASQIQFLLEQNIKHSLADWGQTEVYTPSLVSEEEAVLSQIDLKDHLRVSNPLSVDQVYLRRSLVPSHLNVFKKNIPQDQIQIFEIANVYKKQEKKLPEEELQLVITVSGSYMDLKGLVETLLKHLRIQHQFLVLNEIPPILNPNRSASITLEQGIVGHLGEIKPEILAKIGVAGPVTTAIFTLKTLAALYRPHPAYKHLPKYSPIKEEMTFSLSPKTHIGDAIEEIVSSSKLIESVFLSEIFQENATFAIIYRHPERSLSNAEIAPIRIKIKKNLETHLGARLIGNLKTQEKTKEIS